MPPKKDDPFEFDPFSDIAPEPAPKAPPKKPQGNLGGLDGLDADALFGEADVSASREREDEPVRRPEQPRAKALQLDFTEVLGSEREMRGAQRIGGAVLDNDEFLSKQDREAMARAKVMPTTELPSTLDLEERSSGVKVVHESKLFWVWTAVVILVPVLVIGAGVALFIRYQQTKTEREIEELRRTEEIHRKAQEQLEQRVLH